MSFQRALAVTAIGSIASTTLIAMPAIGQTKSVSDASKDSARFGGAAHSVADIKSLRLTHSKTQVIAVVKFNNLTRDNWTKVYVGSQANRNDPADIAMAVSRTSDPYSRKVWLAGDAGAAPHCNAKVSIKYGKNGWVSLSAPRQCFKDSRGQMPKKIRSYASVYKTNAQGTAGAYDFAPMGRFTKWAKRG